MDRRTTLDKAIQSATSRTMTYSLGSASHLSSEDSGWFARQLMQRASSLGDIRALETIRAYGWTGILVGDVEALAKGNNPRLRSAALRALVTEDPSTDNRERLGLDLMTDLDPGSAAVSAHTLAHLPPGKGDALAAGLIAGLYAHSLSTRVQVFDALVERYDLHEYRDDVLTGPLATLSVQKTTELSCVYLAAADQLRAIVSRLDAGQDPDTSGLRVVDYEEDKVVRFIHSWKEPAFDVDVVRSMSDNDRAWCVAQVVYRMQGHQTDRRALHAAVALDIPNLNTILQQVEAQQRRAGSLRTEPSPYLLEVRQLLQARGVAALAHAVGPTTP